MVARVRSGLVDARKRQGHTLESLAHALSVEPSTVRRWERGTLDPMPLTWPRLAQELDITTDQLVGFLAKPCCEKCGKVLAADNTENLCGACRRVQHGQLDQPPQFEDEFFDNAELLSAFESWHIGRVFRAYRAHPYFLGMFARPLTQENLGRWLGLTQNQMSRQENGKAEQNLELLQEWAAILHLPQDRLWFNLPGQSRLRATPTLDGVSTVDNGTRRTEPNQKLRAVRERTPSRLAPGDCLSRDELAEAVCAWLWNTTKVRYALDGHYIAKLERGTVRWPSAPYRSGLRHVLGATSDVELGFDEHRRGRSPLQASIIEHSKLQQERQDFELVTVESVNRKDFLKTTLGVGAGALLAQVVPNSPNLDLAEILSGPTAHYRRMESAVPSDQLAPAVEAHLRLASHIVQQRTPTAFAYQVMSEIAGLAAWLAVDRGDTATARRRYADAIRCAERAHHPLLVSYMTASLGHFAVETGNPGAGLKIIRRASNLLDQTTPNAARAWIESLCATAHAALGDPEQAIGSLRLAEALVEREGPELCWPWVFKFDGAKVARYQASAFGRMGNVRSATAAYQAAAPALTTPKPRALAQIEHAHVLARSGDLTGGCDLAMAALDTARAYGSERIATRVREFRTSLPVHTVEAAKLDDALSALYEPSSR
ncbi:MAG TPA: helix-turn-helix domain-containing protein [Pseudonocardiaceae bacterium]|nr:helix-turn-helix domain-containing protein [Pseudonocardiaceae bacterium]